MLALGGGQHFWVLGSEALSPLELILIFSVPEERESSRLEL